MYEIGVSKGGKFYCNIKTHLVMKNQAMKILDHMRGALGPQYKLALRNKQTTIIEEMIK